MRRAGGSEAELDFKQFALLQELGESDLELLADLLEPRTLAAGHQLFREGAEADGLWLLGEGRLRLESSRVGDLGCLEAGSSFGVLSLVIVGPREATAVAEELSELWLLTRTAFRRLVEDAPRAACRLLESALADTAGDVRRAIDRLAG